MRRIILESHPWGWSHAIEERHRPLVEALEDFAGRDPSAYRRRVLAGALLGHGFLALVLGVLLGGIALTIDFAVRAERVNGAEIKIIALLAIPTFLLLRALWIRFEPPGGNAITAAEAPALFAAIERVRVGCRAPVLFAVLITDDFNASIVQHPRFGILGGYRNYLLLGLPLMQALDAAAFEAVVAHEFGHLANSDGKLAGFVYRVRATWARLSETLGGDGTGAVLRRFFRWYGPWFNAYSFVLARQNEYAADRMSAAVTSPAIAARALSTVMVEAHRFDCEHWGPLWDQVEHHDRPLALPYAAARSFFADPAADRAGPLARALATDIGLADTHPSLVQRLAALGEPAAAAERCATSAAEALLADGGAALAAKFDRAWWDNVAPRWEAARADVQAAALRLAELAVAHGAGTIDPLAKWEFATLSEKFAGAAAAVPLYTALLTEPGEPVDVVLAEVALARLKLAGGDAGGIDDLERLFGDGDRARLVRPGIIGLALDHLLMKAPGDARIAVWKARQAEVEAREAALGRELGALDARMELTTAAVPGGVVAELAELAAGARQVRKLWLARRVLVHGPPFDQHILLFETRYDWIGTASHDEFMDAAGAALDRFGPCAILQVSGPRKWLRKRVAGIEGALVYDSKVGLPACGVPA